MNIICFGDSITEAAQFVPSRRWPSTLQAKLDAWRPACYQVHNRGVGGDTTARAFDRIEADVFPLLPGLLLVQFGFNDGNVRDWATVPRVGLKEFEKNLIEFHRIAHEREGRCAFIVNHTIGTIAGRQGNRRSYNDNIKPYNAVIVRAAQHCAAPLIDLPSIMAQRDVDMARFLDEDGLHLSARGNRVYAEMVFDALARILSDESP
ncbi:MAG: SGNH/GDSL hydrolase family protein [Acidiferrobacterales bacterium]